MDMEKLKHIKESLLGCVYNQVGDLKNANTEELGDAIDMIKDIEEAIYYCTITKAMNEKEEGERKSHDTVYYTEKYYPYREMDMQNGRMYYNGGGSNSGGSSNQGTSGGNSGGGNSGGGNAGSGSRNYSENPRYMGGRDSYRQFNEMPMSFQMKDYREGRSPQSRRNYMESKETHNDKHVQMKELENYVRELSDDLMEMIEGASTEEKQLLQKKLATLATKIV